MVMDENHVDGQANESVPRGDAAGGSLDHLPACKTKPAARHKALIDFEPGIYR